MLAKRIFSLQHQRSKMSLLWSSKSSSTLKFTIGAFVIVLFLNIMVLRSHVNKERGTKIEFTGNEGNWIVRENDLEESSQNRIIDIDFLPELSQKEDEGYQFLAKSFSKSTQRISDNDILPPLDKVGFNDNSVKSSTVSLSKKLPSNDNLIKVSTESIAKKERDQKVSTESIAKKERDQKPRYFPLTPIEPHPMFSRRNHSAEEDESPMLEMEKMLVNNADKSTVEMYGAVKGMIQMWNPDGSKRAMEMSKEYKKMIRTPEIRGRTREDFEVNPKASQRKIVKSYLEHCGCEREIVSEPWTSEEELDTSMCSQHSKDRGGHQRVVGFSFYGSRKSRIGKERKYYEGILDNLAALPHFYPNWTIRVYYDLPKRHPLMSELCEVACKNPNLDLCYVRDIPAIGDISKVFAMNWRFFPTIDPQVSHYVSRDLDSRFSEREKAAVADWLYSDKSYHFMRDHPAHQIEILGSAWGVRIGEPERIMLKKTFEASAIDPLFWSVRSSYGPDQGLLKRYFWPWGKWSAISHDAYTCTTFPRTQAFPTQRLKDTVHNFVASVYGTQDVLRQECPLKCRPKEHQDWTQC